MVENKELNKLIDACIKGAIKLQGSIQEAIVNACKHAKEHKDTTYLSRLCFEMPESQRPATIRAYIGKAMSDNLAVVEVRKENKLVSKHLKWKDANNIVINEDVLKLPYFAKKEVNRDDFTAEKMEKAIFAIIKKSMSKFDEAKVKSIVNAAVASKGTVLKKVA